MFFKKSYLNLILFEHSSTSEATTMGYRCVIGVNLAGMTLSASAGEAADSTSVVFGSVVPERVFIFWANVK